MLRSSEVKISFIRIRLRFLRTEEGGRKTDVGPITVGSYRPNARVRGSEMHYATWPSEKIDRIPLGQEIEGEWILAFSDEDPYTDFRPGEPIEIIEGERVVARGEIVSRFDRPLSEWHQIRDERNGTKGDSSLV